MNKRQGGGRELISKDVVTIGRNVEVQEKKYGLCLSLFTSKSPCFFFKKKSKFGTTKSGTGWNKPCLAQAET